MTGQDDIVKRAADIHFQLVTLIADLHKSAREAEGGNLSEVYAGARDWLSEADTAVRLALQTLAPEEEV